MDESYDTGLPDTCLEELILTDIELAVLACSRATAVDPEKKDTLKDSTLPISFSSDALHTVVLLETTASAQLPRCQAAAQAGTCGNIVRLYNALSVVFDVVSGSSARK